MPAIAIGQSACIVGTISMPLSASLSTSTIFIWHRLTDGYCRSTVVYAAIIMAVIFRIIEPTEDSAQLITQNSVVLTQAVIVAAVAMVIPTTIFLVLLAFLCFRRGLCTPVPGDHSNETRRWGGYDRDDGALPRPIWPKEQSRCSEGPKELTLPEYLWREHLIADRKVRRVYRGRWRRAARDDRYITPENVEPQSSHNNSISLSVLESWTAAGSSSSSIVRGKLAAQTRQDQLPTYTPSAYLAGLLKDQLLREVFPISGELN
jgi:hypothetical protein